MKDEDIVEKSVPAVSPSLSKEGKTVIRKLSKVLAPFSFISNGEFENLVEEHGLSVKEDLSRRVDLCPIQPSIKRTKRSKT